ncbi:hypothetical protein IE53DRAFT_161612 [Violaceomyces palustris]|uniref:Uncharacterized protein n=1 Tax=Violaceomyces palustris TaxID=1673888 RepID=A0ACD0NTP8_9BASI|nr:hypothetical protein IE53DRAFT_161612 [Violaceomyces palustris]
MRGLLEPSRRLVSVVEWYLGSASSVPLEERSGCLSASVAFDIVEASIQVLKRMRRGGEGTRGREGVLVGPVVMMPTIAERKGEEKGKERFPRYSFSSTRLRYRLVCNPGLLRPRSERRKGRGHSENLERNPSANRTAFGSASIREMDGLSDSSKMNS